MKKLGIFVLGILLLFMFVVGMDALISHSRAIRGRTVHVGDSKQQVEQILGHPVSVFTPLPEARTNIVAALLSVSSETWAYGSRLELRRPFQPEFPYVFPFRLRLFQPDADDVAVEFDSSGKVSKITIP